MYPLRASWFVAPSRMLYNHNPFYLISAALVLFGLQRSVVDWKEDAWRENKQCGPCASCTPPT